MSLSNTLNTWILPCNTYLDGYNARAVWQITEAVGEGQHLDTDWTLVDAGMYDIDICATVGATYPSTSGVAASITDITLKAGDVTMEYVKNAVNKGSIRALQSSNPNSEDINRFTLLAGWGWSINADQQLTLQNDNKDYTADVKAGAPCVNNQFNLANVPTGGVTGGCPLKLLLECMRSLPFIPPTKKLELTVTFNKTPSDYYLNPDASGIVLTPLPCRPQLMLSSYVHPETLPGYRSDNRYSFQSLMTVVDTMEIPAAKAGVPVTTKAILKGFDGKYLKDVMIINQGSVGGAFLPSKTTSLAQVGENIQLFFNNAPVFPYNGINNESLKLTYFNDAYSDYPPLNIPASCYMSGVLDASSVIMDASSSLTDGCFSVGGARIEGVVQDFQAQYTRLEGPTPGQQLPFKQLYFGRIVQVLNWNDLGEVSIQS